MTSFQSRYYPLLLSILLLSGNAVAAADRIVTPVNPRQAAVLAGQVDTRARAANDQGPVDPSTPLSYVTLLLKPSGDIAAFIREQQDPASANYHRWLSPEQFADRFGLSGADIAKLTAWLESEGLTVNDVARGRHWITFGGTAERISRAFRTEIHHYLANGETHFANSTAPSIPAAFANAVTAIRGLDDFGLKSMALRSIAQPALSTSSGNHYLAPDDIATIYDLTPIYKAGITGAGQRIAIAGETNINLSDIRAYRKYFNLPANDPEVISYGSGTITSSGLDESHLDIELAGAVARDATIIYVYSPDVFVAAQYAIDQNLAPVLSTSWGACELYANSGFEVVAQQANVQGITWMVASGDWGATTCDVTAPTPQAAKGLTVDFPADIPEVTAVGGTAFNEGTGTYWSKKNGANGGSALSWIPEIAWNDSLERSELAATGGGASVLFAKPYWQAGPGVPKDGARDVPDVALAASPDHDGYLVYTEGALYVFGGTSCGTPVFAGMAALLNQYLAAQGAAAQAGLGNINPNLYRLAETTTDVFHDVTAGSNIETCVQGSPNCVDGQVGYTAGTGYDLATGLGSVDAWHLLSEWTSGTTAIATTTALTATPASFLLSDTVKLTATVTGAQTTPTGTVSFFNVMGPVGTANLVASGQTAVATLSVGGDLLAPGSGTVSALYSGDAVYAASGATAAANVKLPASGSLVVASITPNPVIMQQIIGYPLWTYSVELIEKAGVATSLTSFTIDGVSQPLNLWNETFIPAYGSASTSTQWDFDSDPGNHVFQFQGVDIASGKAWSQTVTVPYVVPGGAPVPVLSPLVSLTSVPATVLQDTTKDPSCQWSFQLILQELSGYEFDLQQLTWSTGAFAIDGIQQLFGTTQLAPYGMLRANVCRSDGPVSDDYVITGLAEIGTIQTDSPVRLAAPATTPATFSVSPAAVNLTAADSTQSAGATLSLSFSGTSTPKWTVQVLPGSQASNWLTPSAYSGTGPAQLQLEAAAGLSNGVYNAIVDIEAKGSVPPSVVIPVTFVVGASAALSVAGVANGASYGTAFAPGMFMAVFGSNLAPGIGLASGYSLPLNMLGVAVTVNGVAAPLYYVSPGQLNVQVPYETALGTAVLGVNNNGKVTSFQFPVTIAAPGIFAAGDGTLVPSGSGQPGQTLVAFITGAGENTPLIVTGAEPYSGTPIPLLPQPILPVSLTVGGLPAALTFVGTPVGVAGITQINFTIPAAVPAGSQPVIVKVGGVASAPVILNVTATAK
jgi:uncharacterized protein (TIGR03437 family)